MSRSKNQYNQRIGEDPYPDNSAQGGYGSGYGYAPDYGYETERSGAGGYGYANNYNAYGDAYGGSANSRAYDNARVSGHGYANDNNAYSDAYGGSANSRAYDNAYSGGYGSGYSAAGSSYEADPYQQAAEESRTEYDDAEYYDSYDQEDEYNGPIFSASRGIVFKPVKQKKRNILLAIIMTAVMGIFGFVGGKIIQARKTVPEEPKKPMVVQTSEKRPVVVEEEEVPIPQILSVALNTTDPVFGTSRLKIDYEVDSDAMVRIEILNADDTVFTTIESAMEVSEGKMRSYFDGYNEAGEWITLGTYTV